MTRKATIIIETSGGAPVFYIPFPIFKPGGPTNEQVHANEEVKVLFRNTGGMPTFHVGSSELGGAPEDAWDYVTGAKEGMQKLRMIRAGGEPLQVRVEVEKETPTAPEKETGTGKKRDVVPEGRNRQAIIQPGECYLC